jgi:hypothetical protein
MHLVFYLANPLVIHGGDYCYQTIDP